MPRLFRLKGKPSSFRTTKTKQKMGKETAKNSS